MPTLTLIKLKLFIFTIKKRNFNYKKQLLLFAAADQL